LERSELTAYRSSRTIFSFVWYPLFPERNRSKEKEKEKERDREIEETLVLIVSSGRRLIAKEETSDSPRSCRSPRFRYSFEINYADERLFGARGDNDTIERNLMATEG